MGATTDTTAAVERRAMFIKALRERLLDPAGGGPALAGPWAQALETQLRDRLPGMFASTQSSESTLRDRVITCFADAGDQEVRKLFRSLQEAMKAVAQTRSDVWWVNSLTCFALLRTLSLEVLDSHLQHGAVAAPRSDAGAAIFPTSLSVLASMAYVSLYTGLSFDGSREVWARRWVDIPEFGNATDTADAILRELACCLSDEQAERLPRRVNPDDPIHDREIGRLQNRFADDRDDGVASGLCIRRPAGLSDEVWAEALQQLAQRLAADVVGYEERNARHLSLQSSQVGPDALAERIRAVFDAFREATHQPQGEASPAPAEAEWDCFVSHASEDKQDFVDPLVQALKGRQKSVWYDKEQLYVGDDLLRSIEAGLKRSRFVVVVVSRHSLQKPGWVESEWAAVLNRQTTLGDKRVLPVRIGLKHDEFVQQQTFLSRYVTADGDKGVEHVASELVRAMSPRSGNA